jgi:hypothetical protein
MVSQSKLVGLGWPIITMRRRPLPAQVGDDVLLALHYLHQDSPNDDTFGGDV